MVRLKVLKTRMYMASMVDLHSNMVRLKVIMDVQFPTVEENLHSNMVRLKGSNEHVNF